MNDTISIKGLRVLAICGVLAEERERAQPFSIDVELTTSFDAAASSDDLGDTINYAAVSDLVVDIATSSSYQLLEALADHLAREILSMDERIGAVCVSIDKLRPPMAVDVATVGVTRRLGRP